MKAKYICQHHINEISQNPTLAISQLQKLRSIGQSKMNGAHWNEALRFYGTAYEVSYILLHADAVDDITRVKQYLRTALEYGFALRKSSVEANMGNFFSMVKNNIQPFQEVINIEKHMVPIQDISFLPLDEVDYLMMVFFNFEQSKIETRH